MLKKPTTFRDSYYRDPYYLVQFFLVPALGAVLTYAYQNSGASLNPIAAINIDTSAPLILKSFASAVPSITPRRIS